MSLNHRIKMLELKAAESHVNSCRAELGVPDPNAARIAQLEEKEAALAGALREAATFVLNRSGWERDFAMARRWETLLVIDHRADPKI
jgi:hypothetical protein